MFHENSSVLAEVLDTLEIAFRIGTLTPWAFSGCLLMMEILGLEPTARRAFSLRLEHGNNSPASRNIPRGLPFLSKSWTKGRWIFPLCLVLYTHFLSLGFAFKALVVR